MADHISGCVSLSSSFIRAYSIVPLSLRMFHITPAVLPTDSVFIFVVYFCYYCTNPIVMRQIYDFLGFFSKLYVFFNILKVLI